MSCDDSDRVEIAFDANVRVRWDRKTYTDRAVSVGDWYVRFETGRDRNPDPDSNFVVGHHPTGLKIGSVGDGLTFWEAHRVALAMEDSGVGDWVRCRRDGEAVWRHQEPDTVFIFEAIIASALMDHYVFPLANYRVRS